MNSIKGYQLSDVDVIVANHINELPTSYVHVNRWFKHVTNQEDRPSEIAKLPKNVKSDLLAHFGSLFFLTSLTLSSFETNMCCNDELSSTMSYVVCLLKDSELLRKRAKSFSKFLLFPFS